MNSNDRAETIQTENGADVGRVVLALGVLALLALLDDSRPPQTVATTPNAAAVSLESASQ